MTTARLGQDCNGKIAVRERQREKCSGMITAWLEMLDHYKKAERKNWRSEIKSWAYSNLGALLGA